MFSTAFASRSIRLRSDALLAKKPRSKGRKVTETDEAVCAAAEKAESEALDALRGTPRQTAAGAQPAIRLPHHHR
jgi:hypothetical protein